MDSNGVVYGPDCPLRIIALTRTCRANPLQLEGESEHHASVYIRYRWRVGRVGIGPTMDDAVVRAPVFYWHTEPDGTADGTMTLAALRAVLPAWIEIADDTAAARQEAGDDDENV